MGCSWVSDHLSDLIDGDLGPIDRMKARLHLWLCRRCRCEKASLEATVGVLRKLDPECRQLLEKKRDQNFSDR